MVWLFFRGLVGLALLTAYRVGVPLSDRMCEWVSYAIWTMPNAPLWALKATSLLDRDE